MSELITARAFCADFRLQLLVTASALALLAAATEASAGDADRPTVWVELGSQVEGITSGQSPYNPSFLGEFSHLDFDPVLPVQRPPGYATGGEARLNVEPKGSNWVFSASIRYGRANGQKTRNQQLPTLISWEVRSKPGAQVFITHQSVPYHLNTSASGKESHTILDFMAGKDVGLGVFSKMPSVFSAGIRFAQFTANAKAGLNGVPDIVHFDTKSYAKYGHVQTHHRYYGTFAAERSFHGVGPSISWDSSRTIAGSENGGVSFDWGLNAAVLFGRQKVQGSIDETINHYKTFGRIFPLLVYDGIADSSHHHTSINRVRNVTVPNVGGFAGLSLHFPNAKIALGYRADFFFGAMDGGVETSKTYDRGFYGPFANISIGFGG